MLFIAQKVGTMDRKSISRSIPGWQTLCAKDMPGAIATMAMAEGGTLLNAPDVYIQKITIGPGYDKGVVEMRRLLTIFGDLRWQRGATLADHCARHGPAAA
jgi:fructose-1,6-bisphosphatase II / sedoheptulose-1,7-bisphosphatase